MITTYNFTSDSQDIEGNYVLTHNLGTTNILPAWQDDNGAYQLLAGLCHFGDVEGNDQNNKMTFMIGSPVTGTNTILLQYLSANETLATKRIFEQVATEIEPENTDRLVLGKAGKPAFNLEWQKMKNILVTALGSAYFRLTNYFSELDSQAKKDSACNNLGVYTKTIIDNKLILKADLYQANSGASVGIGNTLSYSITPNSHNPATAKYVDDKFVGVSGSLDTTDKHVYIDTVTTHLFSVRCRIAKLNVSIKTTGREYNPGDGTEDWIKVGVLNKLPVLNQYGSGSANRSTVQESILWYLDTLGNFWVKPGLSATTTWYINIDYFVV